MIDRSRRLGRVTLSPGVSRRAMVVFYVAAIFSTCLMAFMNFAQPFVLEEILHVPRAEQGSLSGSLAVISEVAILSTIALAGVLSDRVGRRAIYAAGFVLLGAAYLGYPHASGVSALMALRVLFGLGAACVSAMLATVVADYPVEADRGKATGMMGVMNGIGIMLALFVLAKLPAQLVKRGAGTLAAGRAAYAVVAVLCVAVAILVARGLARGAAAHGPRRPLRALAREALHAAKDPSIALAYGAAFVSRGDLAVVGTFLTLWVTQHATSHGADGAKALATAGMITGISQGAAFVWAPVLGLLADKLHRLTTLAIALLLAGAGYSSMYWVKDPTSGGMIAGACLIGVGEISALIASQVLIGQKAPREARGSVVGVFGLFGALGILVASSLGGLLFDHWARSGPFVLMGIMNLLVLAWTLAVRFRAPRHDAAHVTEPDPSAPADLPPATATAGE